jgi:hypothetical protein
VRENTEFDSGQKADPKSRTVPMSDKGQIRTSCQRPSGLWSASQTLEFRLGMRDLGWINGRNVQIEPDLSRVVFIFMKFFV